MRLVPALALLTLAAAPLLSGCPDRTIAEVNPVQGKAEVKDVPVTLNRDLDLIFMVDNSNSMEQEQGNLRRNFPNFINVLNSIEGGLPNLHLGVISSDVSAGEVNSNSCTCGETGGCPRQGGGPAYINYDPDNNGDNGAYVVGNSNVPPTGHCGINDNANFIEDIAGTGGARQTNYTGSLSDAFSCAANLQTGGCGFEQPLESLKRALDNQSGLNTGFLRENAFLGIVILSDEDDCSASNLDVFDLAEGTLGPYGSFRCFEYAIECDQSGHVPPAAGTEDTRTNCHPNESSPYFARVQTYIDEIKSTKADPTSIVVGEIIGVPPENKTATVRRVGTEPNVQAELGPTCEDPATGEAAPGYRLKQFADGFPERNTVTSICNDDLSDALVGIAELLKLVIGNPCIIGNLADKDPMADGIQPECNVSDRRPGVETQIPQCPTSPGDPSNAPCWYMKSNPEKCGAYPTQLEVAIERGGASVPNDTKVHIECVVQ